MHTTSTPLSGHLLTGLTPIPRPVSARPLLSKPRPNHAKPRPSGLTPLIPDPAATLPLLLPAYLKGPRPSRTGLPAPFLYWPLGGRGAGRRGAGRALVGLREARKAQSSHGRSGKAPTLPARVASLPRSSGVPALPPCSLSPLPAQPRCTQGAAFPLRCPQSRGHGAAAWGCPAGSTDDRSLQSLRCLSQVAECSGTNGPGGRKRPPAPPDLAGTDREGSPPPALAWSWGRGERDGSVGLRPDLGPQLWVSDQG